jgi:hypothetical protein
MCQGCNVKMVVEEAKMALPAVYCPMCAKGPVSFQTPVPPPKTTPMPSKPPTDNLRDRILKKVEEEQRRATTPQPGLPPTPVKEEQKKPPAPPPSSSGPKIIIRKPPPKI